MFLFKDKVNTELVNIVELDNLGKLNDIERIVFNPEVIVNDESIIFCDKKYPLTVPKTYLTNTLCIDKTYYEKSKDLINKGILEIIKNSTLVDFTINDTELINNEVLYALEKNKNIINIYLGVESDPYTLTKEVKNIFENSDNEKIVYTSKISDDLIDDFSDVIGINRSKVLIGNLTYKDLHDNKELTITTELTPEEIDNLKYIDDNATINLDSKYNKNYENMFNIIESLSDKDITFNIELSNKTDFCNYIVNNIDYKDYDNVYIDGLDLITIIEYDKRLDKVVLPIKDNSTYEKYLYIYNIHKNYKDYLSDLTDTTGISDVYELSDDINHTSVYRDLLNKVGIENTLFKIEEPFKNEPDEDFLNVLDEVLIINLKDNKYLIDGYYFSIPKLDTGSTRDAYNFSSLTHDEFYSIYDYDLDKHLNLESLFKSHTKEEIINKIKYITTSRNVTEESKTSVNKEVYKEIINKIKVIDTAKAIRISTRLSKDASFNDDNLSNIFNDISELILDKTNNMIEGSKYIDAIRVLYRDIYKHDEFFLEDEISDVIEFNKQRQDYKFPTTYLKLSDGREVPIKSKNKFDI